MSKSVSGSCLCGNCSFSVPSASIKFGFSSCHCSKCRLSHAAPFVQWSGLYPDKSDDFILSDPDSLHRGYRSSEACTRYFCSKCGTHVYIKYDRDYDIAVAGELHFPTAILTTESVNILEEAMKAVEDPRYFHEFISDRSPCLGNLEEWAAGAQLSGAPGLAKDWSEA